MYKLIFITAALLLLQRTSAQQLTPQTLNSGGSSKTAAGLLIEDAIGGLLVNTISTPLSMYTQDFLQPDAGTTTTLPIINNVVLSSGSAIDNAGTVFTNTTTMLEFTVGEFASITLNGGSNMLTQGILQPYTTGVTLPVTGMEFYAKRLNGSTVQLDWKTIQEINNKGFHIERKKENETAFNEVAFVGTKALNGGNSSFSLDYQKLDNNTFTGISYYRIKQEDTDGKASYSVVRFVNGDSKQLSMQVWPVPAIGFFNINVTGIEKTELVKVMDMNGRLVKQIAVQNNTQQQVSGLPAGTYYIKLSGDKHVGQKVIIQ